MSDEQAAAAMQNARSELESMRKELHDASLAMKSQPRLYRMMYSLALVVFHVGSAIDARLNESR